MAADPGRYYLDSIPFFNTFRLALERTVLALGDV